VATLIAYKPKLPALLEPMLAVLTRYVSPPTAHSIVKLAQQRVPGGGGLFDRRLARAMLEPIEKHLGLYVVDQSTRLECIVALRALLDRPGSGEPELPRESRVTLEIRSEEDVARARTASREIAVQAGFSVTGQTRLVTCVSELARNIVQYAREGRIELETAADSAGVEITAHDDGPGIANVEEVLAGRYRSKLGMGLGLRGVKRLAQRFEIKTGHKKGTVVTAFLEVV
jgi:serine/threonine-protein kinase RsbT